MSENTMSPEQEYAYKCLGALQNEMDMAFITVKQAYEAAENEIKRANNEKLKQATNHVPVVGMPTGVSLRNDAQRSIDLGAESSSPAHIYNKALESLKNNGDYQNYRERATSFFRSMIIERIGEDKYNELCENRGCEVSETFFDAQMVARIEQYAIEQNMPKGSFDYITQSIMQPYKELMYLINIFDNTPDEEKEFDKKAFDNYNPTTAEFYTAYLSSIAIDIASIIATGGTSAAAMATKGVASMSTVLYRYSQIKPSTPEEAKESSQHAWSMLLYGSDYNEFENARKYAEKYQSENGVFLQLESEKKGDKTEVYAVETDYGFDFNGIVSNMTDLQPYVDQMTFDLWCEQLHISPGEAEKIRTKLISEGKMSPAPDQTFEHKMKEAGVTPPRAPQNWITSNAQPPKRKSQRLLSPTASEGAVEEDATAKKQDNEDKSGEDAAHTFSWQKFFEENGFSGDILNNLGTILATLPETIGAFFSGKKKIEWGKSAIPGAMIMMGLFSKNPLLKLALVTVGAAAFLNKNTPGLDAKRAEEASKFKKYEDEALNPRISNPVLKSNTLMMDIDGVSYCVALPATAAQAYAEGALPLNKLANAVLENYDSSPHAVNRQMERDALREQQQDPGRGIYLR